LKMIVQVSYALPDKQVLRRVEVDAPATIAQAIAASGIAREFAEIDLAKNRVGVFGRRSTLDAQLHDGDRVEIYRPLIFDPKESRRRRAEHAKRLKRGGG
jgi:putative ubiquitin-RnfH superfamily antitoxin RatB of RatAB toxin-antitoxin module